jgi:N-acylglucosamine-6-phosphate 2-epimerase
MKTKKEILDEIRGTLIVSCQAREGWAMHGSSIMAAFAAAAMEGGAGGIRANGAADIQEIKKKVSLPLIGIQKIWQDSCEGYITPTYESAVPIIEAGAEIIALDATARSRPNHETFASIVKRIRDNYPHVLIMGEISAIEEAKVIKDLDIDLISTTLSGYTAASKKTEGVDLNLIGDIVAITHIPVIAEGKIRTEKEVVEAFQAGAHAVVVGTSITRPEIITSRYTAEIKRYFESEYIMN